MIREEALPLLGSRTYLHGTTIFELLESEMAGGRDILFQMSRLITSDRVAVETFDPAEGRKKLDAFAIWTAGNVQVGRGLVALPPSDTPRRAPYDEEAIRRSASFSDERASLNRPTRVGFLKAAIALNKSLVTRAVRPPDDGRQWLFTRLELDALPPPDALFELAYRSRFALSAVRTDMKFATGQSGSIYFSWQAVSK